VADTSQSRIIDTTAFEIGSSVGRKVCASIATLNSRDNFALSRFLIAGGSSASNMRTKDHQASEEKRAYYRLLRYLVSNELQASYREDQARPLQLTDLLKELEHHEPFKIH
jgi:predicted RNA-binding Zn ribbon-like protein